MIEAPPHSSINPITPDNILFEMESYARFFYCKKLKSTLTPGCIVLVFIKGKIRIGHIMDVSDKIDGVEIDGENRNALYLKINWFVQTNDLPCNIHLSMALHFQFSGIKEVFMTADTSWISSSDIVDLAFVFSFEQIKEKEFHEQWRGLLPSILDGESNFHQ